MVSRRALVARFALALALAPAAVAANVTILGQPASYATLQAAVDAAVDGDVLLVDPGSYSTGFTIDNKSLSVIGNPGGIVSIHRQCKVLNLAASRTVILAGIRINPSSTGPATIPALEVTSCTGHVRLQTCRFTGAPWNGGWPNASGPGGPAAQITGSTRVVATQCVFQGADEQTYGGDPPCTGGIGLLTSSSTVAVFDCTVLGGDGSTETYPSGGKGGAACVVNDFGVVFCGSSVKGGRGGGGDWMGCTTSGDGGDGLVLNGSQAQALNVSLIAGLQGGFYTCDPGVPGEALVINDGVYNDHPGTRRRLDGPIQTSDNATVSYTVTGEPGDKFWLVRKIKPAFRYLSPLHGVVALPSPWFVTATPLAVIGPGGTASVALVLGDLTGPEPGTTWFLQGFCTNTLGERFVTDPLQLLIVNN